MLVGLIPVTYVLPPDTTTRYTLEVSFEGYLPVLGGKDGKAAVLMQISVLGLKPETDGTLRASSDITDLKLSLNGAALPVALSGIKTFFPKTTVELSPEGKILRSDAPDVKLPVRLPGLDPKRFPDITYLPLEFPKGGIVEGKEFQFRKGFGGNDVTYRVHSTKIDDAELRLAIDVEQEYTTYEDDSHNPLPDDKGATSQIVTHLLGHGTAVFSRLVGSVGDIQIDADATSVVTDLASKQTSNRALKTRLHVKRVDKP